MGFLQFNLKGWKIDGPINSVFNCSVIEKFYPPIHWMTLAVNVNALIKEVNTWSKIHHKTEISREYCAASNHHKGKVCHLLWCSAPKKLLLCKLGYCFKRNRLLPRYEIWETQRCCLREHSVINSTFVTKLLPTVIWISKFSFVSRSLFTLNYNYNWINILVLYLDPEICNWILKVTIWQQCSRILCRK